MRYLIYIFFIIFLINTTKSEEIKIFYPSQNYQICRSEQLIIKWKGNTSDYIVEAKSDLSADFKKIKGYELKDNIFYWYVNDTDFLNVPFTIRISNKSDLTDYDEITGISVFEETRILDQTNSVVTCAGDEVYLKVDALGYGLTYQWFKDGIQIENQESSTFLIKNAEYKNSGSYSCKINSAGECGSIKSKPVSVYIATPTQFTARPDDVFWEFEKNARMTGEIHTNSEFEDNNIKFKWYKDTIYTIIISQDPIKFIYDTVKIELTDNDRINGSASQSLEITHLFWSDRGTYYCIADGLCGSDTVSCIIGEQDHFKIIKVSPDYFGCDGIDITFKARLETNIKGNFTFQWYKAGFKMLQESDKYIGTKTLQLTIKNPKHSSDGNNYYVLVTLKELDIAQRSEAFQYDPKFAPEISYQAKDWVIKSRRDYKINEIYLEILFRNIMSPLSEWEFEWYKDGKLVYGIGGIGDSAKSVGWYQCKITNSCGSVWSDSIHVAYGYDDVGACLGKSVVIQTFNYGDEYYNVWMKNGIVLEDTDRMIGTTSNRLVITNLQTSDDGSYKVYVINKKTNVKFLDGIIFVEAREAPYMVRDYPDLLQDNDGHLRQAVATVISQSPGVYYTLYIDGKPVGDEKFKATDIYKNKDFGFVLGGYWSNLKPGKYKYHFRNQCGETWSNEMTVINSAYKDGGIIQGEDEDGNIVVDFKPYSDNISGVSNSEMNSNFMIHPNPAEDFITIQTSEVLKTSEDYNIQVFNTLGIEVLTESIHPMTSNHRMNISALPAGVYFVRINGSVWKFVKI